MEENNQNQLVIIEDTGMVAELKGTATAFCSLPAETNAEKAVKFRTMNNPDKRIGDEINTTINIKDVYAEMIELVNKETSEIQTVPRIVLIDDNGISHQAVSIGIYSAVKKLIQVYGMPTWMEPVKVKIIQKTIGERKMLTFDVVG